MAWGMKNYTIQLFGSSIIEGRIGVNTAAERWYELMRSQLCEQFPATCFAIYNGAVGGESIRELMSHFDRDLEGHSPDLCIAMFCWNNFVMDADMKHFVPVAEQRKLMEKFAERLPKRTKVVGVISQPMIDSCHHSYHNHAYDDIRSKYGSLNAFHDIERNLSRAFFIERNIPFLDLTAVMGSEPEKYVLTSDGIHLTPEGHRLFATEMCLMLEDILLSDGCN